MKFPSYLIIEAGDERNLWKLYKKEDVIHCLLFHTTIKKPNTINYYLKFKYSKDFFDEIVTWYTQTSKVEFFYD